MFPTPGFSFFNAIDGSPCFSPNLQVFFILISRFLAFWGLEVCFYHGYSCLEAFHLHIFMIERLCTVIQLFKGSYFSVCVVLLQDISDLIQLSGTVQGIYFLIYEFCYTCFKVEYKRSYIFKVLQMKQSLIFRYEL